MAEAGWTAESVQMIVFATMTPDVTFPGAGCFLQDKLGAGTVGAMDVRGQCAGYLMGLAVANDLIACGKAGGGRYQQGIDAQRVPSPGAAHLRERLDGGRLSDPGRRADTRQRQGRLRQRMAGPDLVRNGRPPLTLGRDEGRSEGLHRD